MSRRIRARLTYANVVATLALFVAVGGGTVYAATHLGRNSVSSANIRDGQVKTQDLANAAVTSAKLADNSVTGPKLADNSVTSANVVSHALTGADIDTSTLRFGCVTEGTHAGDQMPGGGFCAVRLHISGQDWYHAVQQCWEAYPTSTLPTAAQVQALAAEVPAYGGPMVVWTGQVAGPGNPPTAWLVGVATNSVNGAQPYAMNTTQQTTDTVCVYDPAGKNG
jgi:hypothetical protein